VTRFRPRTLDPAAALSKYVWQCQYPGLPYELHAQEAEAGLTLAEQMRWAIVSQLPPAAFS
jgi:hypothetical protein